MARRSLSGKEVLRLFPQLGMVSRKDWVEKAQRIWMEVWSSSKWPKLEKAPASLRTPRASLVNHTRAVLQGALSIAEARARVYGEKVDRDILIIAAVIHDVSKLVEYEPFRGKGRLSRLGEAYQHGFYAAYRALVHDLPPEIVHIVLSHTTQTKSVPRSKEGLVLYYADMADADLNRHRENAPSLLGEHK